MKNNFKMKFISIDYFEDESRKLISENSEKLYQKVYKNPQ